jgi:hypothetical protein
MQDNTPIVKVEKATQYKKELKKIEKNTDRSNKILRT